MLNFCNALVARVSPPARDDDSAGGDTRATNSCPETDGYRVTCQFVIENRNQQWIVLSQAASQKQSLGLIYSGETSMALMRG